MATQIVVLGSCGAWPEAGRACSGFLLQHDAFRIVIDLGYGTLPRLLTLLGSSTAAGLDAVVVTHRHPDHMVDLHGLFRARWFGHRDEAAIPLYADESVLARVAALEEDDVAAVRHVFDWHPLPADEYDIGPFWLESTALPHFVPNAGIRLSTLDVTIAYTGDTGPDPALAHLARDADLFIAEASDRNQRPETPAAEPGPRMHLTARDAAIAATEAGARRLMLTHFWPGNDRARTRDLAADHFAGEIILAEEGLEVRLA
ncbi:MAG: MBL fold metallo-hydrolase [Streptosporangiales bacterium]